MKQTRKLINNILTLLVLLVVGGGVVWFFTTRSQNDQPVAQEAQATPDQRATPTPATEPKPTATPVPPSSDLPPDDQPEPTWTPAIVLPEGSPPPLPTPFPTPTATPVNPNEQELASIDMPLSMGPVSPDGKTLVFTTLQVETPSKINPYNQLWKLDLVSNQLTKLTEFGADPRWSPDSLKLVFQIPLFGEIDEVKVVDADGQNERLLLDGGDILDYYWANTEQVALVQPNRISRANYRTSQIVEDRAVNLPRKDPQKSVGPKIAGHSSNIIVVKHNGELTVTRPDSQIVTIAVDKEGQNISEFTIAPNGQQIAYVVRNPPYGELWIADTNGQKQRKLYELQDKNLQLMAWSPDSQLVIVGWSYKGVNLTGGQTPVLINVENGQVASLGIDEVNVGLTFSPNGRSIYYGRTNFYQNLPSDQEKSTLYQLEVKR